MSRSFGHRGGGKGEGPRRASGKDEYRDYYTSKDTGYRYAGYRNANPLAKKLSSRLRRRKKGNRE